MILLVNDDGIDAPGLRALYAALRSICGRPVLAVAPSHERSGQSHAITIDRALTATARMSGDFFGFAIDGTPVDCVKLAIARLCPTPPELVVSGINDGPNVGRSIFYSGTLGAAMEAAIAGLPALAASRARGADEVVDPAGARLNDPRFPAESRFADGAALTADLARKLLAAAPRPGRVVSLNIPAGPATGWRPLRLARHALGGFVETYAPQSTGDGRTQWVLDGAWSTTASSAAEADDAALLSAGHPVVTTLRPDVNDDAGLATLAPALGKAHRAEDPR